MKIHTILALTDFSAGAENALERAALIAARHKAELRLMYVNESCGDWLADRQTWLAQRAHQLSRRYQITAVASSRIAVTLNDVLEASRRADLLVLDPLSGRSFKGSLRGRALDQVARHSQCPVLVAKTYAHTPYDKALVALGSTNEINDLIRYARNFETAAARMGVRMFLARGMRKNNSSTRIRTAPDWRDRLRRAWKRGTQNVMRSIGRWTTGSAAFAGRDSVIDRMIEQCASLRAKIVIVPRRKPPIVPGFLGKDPTQRLLRSLSCDLVLVPADELTQAWTVPALTAELRPEASQSQA